MAFYIVSNGNKLLRGFGGHEDALETFLKFGTLKSGQAQLAKLSRLKNRVVLFKKISFRREL